MKSIRFLAIVCLGLALFFFSCTEDYFEFDKITTEDWRPNLALPLVNSNLTLEDIIIKEDTGEAIQTDPNSGVLEIVYDGSVFTSLGAASIPIPTLNFNESFSPPSNIPASAVPPTVSYTHNDQFSFNASVEIDSLALKNGEIQLTLESRIRHNVQVDVEFESIVDPSTGQTLSMSFSLPYNPNNYPVSRMVRRSLDGYKIDMAHGSQNHSTVPIKADITVNRVSGNGISTNEGLSFSGSFGGLEFREFWGYVNNIPGVDLNMDTINVTIFRNFIGGTFFISEPTLDVTITNSYRFGTTFRFDTLTALNERRAPFEIDIASAMPNDNPKTLNVPTGPGVAVTEINLDKGNQNGNIDEVISMLVKQIVYDASATFNIPTNGDRLYLADTSGIGVDVFLRIPFEGRAQDFVLMDTIDFNFEGASEIESGLIRVRSNNGFPVDARTQVVFLDSNENTIDSLYYDDQLSMGGRSVIESAITDINGEVISPTSTVVDVTVDRERLANLTAGRYAVIRAVLNTEDATNQNNVRFLPGYSLDISLGVKATILID